MLALDYSLDVGEKKGTLAREPATAQAFNSRYPVISRVRPSQPAVGSVTFKCDVQDPSTQSGAGCWATVTQCEIERCNRMWIQFRISISIDSASCSP